MSTHRKRPAMPRTTALIGMIVGILITLSGGTLVIETIQSKINNINFPIGLFLMLIGVTAILNIWNEYLTQKDIQCVKIGTQSKTLSNTSTADSAESNNNSNSEQ